MPAESGFVEADGGTHQHLIDLSQELLLYTSTPSWELNLRLRASSPTPPPLVSWQSRQSRLQCRWRAATHQDERYLA